MFIKIMLKMKNGLGSTILLNTRHIIQFTPGGKKGEYAEITLANGLTYNTTKSFADICTLMNLGD